MYMIFIAPPPRAEISRERKIVRLRMKNHLAEIDFSFGAERNEILLCPETKLIPNCITAN